MRLKYTFEMMELDDSIIAIPLGTGATEFRGVIKLNDTAAFMLNLLKNEITEEQLVKAVAKEYDMPCDFLVDDVKQYLNEFNERKMLI